MERLYKSKLIRKALALVLALVVGLTFIPLLGGNAYAADADQTEDISIVIPDQAEGEGGQAEITLGGPSQKKSHAVDITEPNVPEEEAGEAGDSDAVVLDEISPDDLERIAAEAKYADLTGNTDVYTFSLSRSGSTLIINTALKSPYTNNGCIGGVYVDDSLVYNISNYSTTKLSNLKINLSSAQLKPGFHTVDISLYLQNTHEYVGYYSAKYRAEIAERPTYAGLFEVYSNYLVYAPYNIGYSNRSYDLYLEYSADGGKTWSRSGYMRSNMIQLATQQQYTISGLIPNRSYITRIRYGMVDSGTLFLGPALGTGTYKTGQAKAPSIKSVNCKAVKVKRHKVRHYGYYTGVYLYTEKYYTYKVKITVKLKKKPGTAGIWINGKFCKGNKKKYTATFTPYPNYSVKKPKGIKWTVGVCSYQNSSYGGYSPLYQKTKKLK